MNKCGYTWINRISKRWWVVGASFSVLGWDFTKKQGEAYNELGGESV